MRYIATEEILLIHERIVDIVGGRQGIRDTNLLQSITLRAQTAVFGEQQYKTVFEKAAVYLQSIAQYHVFIDGNKRTAIAVAARFMYVNRHELQATNAELEKFTLRVVEEKLDIPELAAWFEQNTKTLA